MLWHQNPNLYWHLHFNIYLCPRRSNVQWQVFMLNIHLSIALIFIEKTKHTLENKTAFRFVSIHMGSRSWQGMFSLLVWNTNTATCPARIFSTNLDISARRPHLLRGHGFSVSDSRHREEEKHRRLLHVTLVSLHHKNKNPCRQKKEQWVRF